MSTATPHDPEAEAAMVGSVILGGREALTYAQQILRGPADIVDSRHRAIFDAILALDERGDPIELVTLQSQLQRSETLSKAGGIEYAVEVAESVPHSANVDAYARQVREQADRARAAKIGSRLAQAATDPGQSPLEVAEQAQTAITGLFDGSESSGTSTIGEDLEALYDQLQQQAEGHGEQAIKTKLPDLDRMLGGLWPGQNVVVAARPGAGKSAFALQLAQTAALQGTPTAIFSLEMSRRQIAERVMARQARIPLTRTRGVQTPQPHDWTEMAHTIGAVSDWPIYSLDSKNLRPSKMLASARWLQARWGVGLIIVDYLQLLRGDERHQNRAAEVSEISRQTKLMALELGVPVVCLSQLNREGAREKRPPRLMDLRESGSIEQDADVVLFLHNRSEEDDEHKDLSLIVAKQRQGETGSIPLHFDGAHQDFAVRDTSGRYGDGE